MAGTTWKSPLSILMGAAKNDDDDLELNDYFHPTRSTTPASETKRTDSGLQTHTPGSTKSGNNGVSSYLPFRNFGLKSPAPTPAKDNIMNGSTNNTSFNGSPVPPLSSFPPQIQSTDEIIEHIGDIATDIEDRQNSDDHQYSGVSHPFFHQLDLTAEDRGDDKSNNNDQYNDINNIDEQATLEKKAYITWSEQKAIIGTTFNFTNSIIGAGAMGLGGAFAASGGGISVIMLCIFAYLMKLSLDLLIDLCNCPLIIQLARKNEAEHNRCDDIDDIESDFDDDDDEDDDNVSFANSGEPVFEQVNMDSQDKSEAQHVATDALEDEENHQSNSDSPDDENKTGDSSPLMARQEEDENDVNAETKREDILQTLTATTGLKDNIHPLAASPERRNREELLTMDVTEPRYFSPLLHLDPDTNPKVNAEKKSIPKQYQHITISPCTYEELGRAAYGANGRLAVLLSKSLYAFGCLVAYVVVVRDNFGPALRRITIEGQDGSGWLYDDNFLAFWVSAIFMLPLSCPRTMKPLAKFSFVSILSIIFLVLVVIYLYFTCINPEGSTQKLSFYENWIEIRSLTGLVQSLGCFVFTFVCHHTVNLAYESLPTPIRNTKVWRRVSTNSIALALQSSLAIGIFAYLTFGAQTPADVLMGYPSSLTLANVARLLLCLTMVLTFPLPFLTCREMTILTFVDMYSFYHKHNLKRYNFCSPMWETTVAVLTSIWAHCKDNNKQNQETTVRIDDAGGNLQMQRPSFWKRVGLITENANEDNCRDLAQALLEDDDEYGAIRNIGGDRGKEINPSPLSSRSGSFGSSETTVSSIVVPTPSWLLTDRQLTFAWHAVLTFSLWTIVTICAILSPSLGDVLDVVGAGTGTLLSFVLPALFSFKLRGYSNLALAIFVIGGITGLLGTVFSCIKFMKDAI